MYVIISKRARVLMILVANRVVDFFLYLLISVNFYRYIMMLDCWQGNPENRPTFTQIRENLEAIMQKDNPYLDLTAVDETRAEYNAQSFNSIPEQSDEEESDNNVEIVVHEGTAGEGKKTITEKYPQSTNMSVDINTHPGTESSDCARNHQHPETSMLSLNTMETRF